MLLLTRWYETPRDDVQASVFELSKCLSLAGHDVEILGCGQAADRQMDAFAAVTRLREGKNRSGVESAIEERAVARAFQAEIERRAARARPDVVISSDAMLSSLALALMPEVPVINLPQIDARQYALVRKKDRNPLRALREAMRHDALMRRIDAQANAVTHCAANVVPCQSMKRSLIQSYGVEPGRVFVRAPGCAVHCEPDEALRRPAGESSWLYVGRGHEADNPAMLLSAIALMPSVTPSLTLVCEEEAASALRDQCARLSLSRRVRFERAKASIKEHYLSANLVIVPAWYDVHGRVVREAFACGVPVAGFASVPGVAHTAMAEWIEPGVTGYLCGEYTPEALARTLMRAAHVSERELDVMRRACYRRAPSARAWEEYAGECARLGELARERLRARK